MRPYETRLLDNDATSTQRGSRWDDSRRFAPLDPFESVLSVTTITRIYISTAVDSLTVNHRQNNTFQYVLVEEILSV